MRPLPHPCTLAVLLAIALPVSGCDKKPSNKPKPLDTSDFVVTDDLAPLLRALGDREIGAGEPPGDASLRWTMPSNCALRYAQRGSTTLKHISGSSDTPSTRPGTGLSVDGSFTVQPGGPADLEVEYGDLSVHLVQNGEENPRSIQAANTLARTWLELDDGRGLREVKGPTAAWSAYGSFPGPVLFFPTLPRKSERGARSTWDLTTHAEGSGSKVEVERGSSKLSTIPEPVAIKRKASVKLERWLNIDGQSVAYLVAEWSWEESSEEPTPLPGDGGMLKQTNRQRARNTGRYLVHQDGQLLAARVERTIDVTMKIETPDEPGPKTVVQRQEGLFEARLLRGCHDGQMVARDFHRVQEQQMKARQRGGRAEDDAQP